MPIESKIKEQFLLKNLTSYKIGGRAEFFLEVKNRDDLTAAFEWAEKKGCAITVFAGGSNVLISDLGLNGLVIKMNNQDIQVKGERIECGAGAQLSRVLSHAISHNLAGLEWSAGIPGSMGGAIRGNAGAFGHAMNENSETVEVYDRQQKQFMVFSNKDCKFSYRDSIFKQNSDLIIWQSLIKLKNGSGEAINNEVNRAISYRTKTQPKLPSAGCVFKNIAFSDLEAGNQLLAARARSEGVVKGGKVGAGWIIDQLDLSGKKIGDAKISLEHCNFIVNTGKATAQDVIMLISYIKQQARDKFGIQLFEEIEYLS